MYGIFMECFVTLRQYFGGYGEPDDNFRAFLVLGLFLISAVYIIVADKNPVKKWVFGILPVAIVVGFLLPITKKVYARVFSSDATNTYYRLLWIIPMYVVVAYAACLLLMKMKSDVVRRIVVVALMLVIVFTGKYAYSDKAIMFKAENLYHIPQEVIDICDLISPEGDDERVWAIFPEELTWFVRQYDSKILMPYGADYIEEGFTSVAYYAMKNVEVIDGVEVLDIDKLIEATRFEECRYIIIPEDTDTRKMSKDPTKLGLRLVKKVDRFYVYEDPVIAAAG